MDGQTVGVLKDREYLLQQMVEGVWEGMDAWGEDKAGRREGEDTQDREEEELGEEVLHNLKTG